MLNISVCVPKACFSVLLHVHVRVGLDDILMENKQLHTDK